MAGKNRDRQRKKNKHSKRLQEDRDRERREMHALEMMAAQAKKRYKVEVLEEAVATVIVWATDPQEAEHLVMQWGEGRFAGRKGPQVAGVKVTEMGEGNPSNEAIVEAADVEKDSKVQSLIEVVGG